jgi:hypothetical protein
MPLHILLCDEVLLYFIVVYRNRLNFKFKFESNKFGSIKGFYKKKSFLLPKSLLGRFPAAVAQPPANQPRLGQATG